MHDHSLELTFHSFDTEVDALDVLQKTNDSLQTKQTERNHKIQLKTKQLQQYQVSVSLGS